MRQLSLKGRELGVNLLLGFPFANDFFTIAAQEIVNGFDSDPD